MKTPLALALGAILGVAVPAAEAPPHRVADLREAQHQYAHDDQLLAGARHYQNSTREKEDTVRTDGWLLETGEPLKVAQERQHGTDKTLEEYSQRDGTVYFVFRREETKLADGGTRVTEQRMYFDTAGELIAKRRRTADFPAGVPPELPAKMPSEEMDLKAIPEAERSSYRLNERVTAIYDQTVKPEGLIHDPAKDAPAEWKRVKLVRKSLSPNGRYALGVAPKKKVFDWDDYREKDLGPDDFELDREQTDEIENYIVDLSTHRLAGHTLGKHFGNRASYNHDECEMIWSPDSHLFCELNSGKWAYKDCSIGEVQGGKVTGVLNLGPALRNRAVAFLVASKQTLYRQHAKELTTALAGVDLQNDGSGSAQVIFQNKEYDVTVDVRFRVAAGAKGLALDIVDAKLGKD